MRAFHVETCDATASAIPRPNRGIRAASLGRDRLHSLGSRVTAPLRGLSKGVRRVRQGWLGARTLNALTKQATPGELDKVAEHARVLREWFRGFVRHNMGRPLTPKAIREIKPLNALPERDEMFSRVSVYQDTHRHHLELQITRRWRSPESLLLPIGEALARCVCDEDFADLRACEGHRCTLVFADHTRRRGRRWCRRWCSWAMCGNRAKQALLPGLACSRTRDSIPRP